MSFEETFRGVVSAEVQPISRNIERLTQMIEFLADKVKKLETAKGTTGIKKELLSARDVEAIIGRKSDWIYRHIRMGKFPENKSIGNRVFWAREDIEKWVEMHKQ
ncbi:AlpA family phage regulatory protein [Thiotrichales bacterium 19S9-12]|nr:AlpA family phage regulatory protein [Thiotrichales bacterium 19S9-11]MCF6812538.1 AlpA family phage regulatory protein [Thiotrichales bacterium 19S9-12]